MSRRTIILLEDNSERVRQFESAVAQLAPEYKLRVWRDAERIMQECHVDLADVALISLDHDLNKETRILRIRVMECRLRNFLLGCQSFAQ